MIRILTLILILFATLQCVSAQAGSAQVFPATQVKRFTQSLSGNWSFKYFSGPKTDFDTDFFLPGFDVTAWKKITVPSNWELQGFAEPEYALDLKEGVGLYRRNFVVPKDLRGDRRVFLRFEGVAYGFEVWINGKKVGKSSASAYNPHTFDITDSLDKVNVIAVRVTTKPLGYEFDVNDDWALSGIFRDVIIFSVPAVHLQDVSTRTKLTSSGNDTAADLTISALVNNSSGKLPVIIRGKLIAPDGKTVQEFELPSAIGAIDHRRETTVHVTKPQLWTAESPHLYRLQLTLSDGRKILQNIEERIGLREISIANKVLLLNGRPIKLRGVNHHDIDPESGRAMTVAQMRRDLEMMKRGNINFVRTSHYPPDRRFIELCDELGFYVMDEVSIGKGEEHLNDAAYRENILARVEPTITRDKNRPSVIVWSIGNENPVTDVEMEAGKLAKQLDPSRPICYPKIGSYFAENYQRIPEFVDIYAPHYPTNSMLLGYTKTLTRPTIFTEYAHALGLATDRIQDQWEIMQSTPHFAGGAIWHFMDQGILRKSTTPVDRSKSTVNVWLDEYRYYDKHGNDGTDGIVYSDRSPQTDFWQTRKVYAPVQITERSAVVRPGSNDIALTIENRYDFRSLAGIKLEWSLQRNKAEIGKGTVPLSAAAHEFEKLQVPINIPSDTNTDIFLLVLRCVDETELQINERTLRLDLPDNAHNGWPRTLPSAGKTEVTESQSEIKIINSQWALTISRVSGALTIRNNDGKVLVDGIHPHTSRNMTMAEARTARTAGTWTQTTLTKLEGADIKVSQQNSTVLLSVSGRYPRAEGSSESFVGGYSAEIAANGTITITYDYVPTNATGKLTEAGLSISAPQGMTEFRWLGQGPYSGYPGKDRLNEFGLFHLNREDLYFQGNRRETRLAMLTTASGEGIALSPSVSSDIAVDREGTGTLLSHNAVISGPGNKGVAPETFLDAAKVGHITGVFTLVPLTNSWPSPLSRWFGQPGPAREIYRPFYHSYDQ